MIEGTPLSSYKQGSRASSKAETCKALLISNSIASGLVEENQMLENLFQKFWQSLIYLPQFIQLDKQDYTHNAIKKNKMPKTNGEKIF